MCACARVFGITALSHKVFVTSSWTRVNKISAWYTDQAPLSTVGTLSWKNAKEGAGWRFISQNNTAVKPNKASNEEAQLSSKRVATKLQPCLEFVCVGALWRLSNHQAFYDELQNWSQNGYKDSLIVPLLGIFWAVCCVRVSWLRADFLVGRPQLCLRAVISHSNPICGHQGQNKG